METTGEAQRVFLDVGEQRQAQRGRADRRCVAARFKAHRLAPAVRDPDFLVLGVDARPCMAKSKAARNRLIRSMRGSASQAAIAPKSRYSTLQALCAAVCRESTSPACSPACNLRVTIRQLSLSHVLLQVVSSTSRPLRVRVPRL